MPIVFKSKKEKDASDRARFLSYVDQSAGPDGCWPWTGAIYKTGYGQFNLLGRRTGPTTSHRASYAIFVGKVRKGLVIHHLCENKKCVNPKHLEQMTQGRNIRLGTAPSAIHARKTHCPNGHEYTPENTRQAKHMRVCRTCDRERTARRFGYKNAKQGDFTIPQKAAAFDRIIGRVHQHMRDYINQEAP